MNMGEPADHRNGRIVTFYSFKGGVGRTMALANVAWILASTGRRVLAVDWDLESPGLHRYFAPFLVDRHLSDSPGVIDAVRDFARLESRPDGDDMSRDLRRDGVHSAAAVGRFVSQLVRYEFDGGGSIDFMPAGRQDRAYSHAVSTFNWDDFYERFNGAAYLDALAEDMRRHYDLALIDSRTGLSDNAGICTVQLPDAVVTCFTMSNQSIDGTAAVANSIRHQRGDGIQIYPVPMRVENVELAKLGRSRLYARQRFEDLVRRLGYGDPDEYWSQVEIPYRSFYAYEEVLAVFGDPPGQADSLLAAYERLTRELVGDRPAALSGGSAVTSVEKSFRPILSQPATTSGRPAAFISYVREDYESVDKIADALQASGIDAWLDRYKLMAGDRWIDEIRRAIENGDFFIACFSPSYEKRERTYMNVELRLAVDLLRQFPRNRRWFIPIKLGPCTIPEFDIGGGETLDHFHHVDFSKDWDRAIQQLSKDLTATRPTITSAISTAATTPVPAPPDAPTLAERLRLAWLAEFEQRGTAQSDPLMIAYAPRDRIWAEWIAAQLGQVGQRSTLQDLNSPAVLDRVTRTLVLLSRESVRVPQTVRFWQAALARDTPGTGRLLVPVRLEGFRMPPPFDDQEPVDLYNITGGHAREALLTKLGLRDSALVIAPATSGPQPRFPAEPARVWRAPARNASFTGRDALLDLLRERLNASTAMTGPAVLQGFGGVGKTQIAAEYLHRFAADYDIVWWISAEQPALVRAALADLAAELGPPRAGNASEAVQAVLEALRLGEPSPRWIVVFDNADDPNLIREFIPSGPGDVLITTPGREWAREAWTIDVNVFERVESTDLLSRRVNTLSPADANSIAEKLGDLPLAVEQAATWLATTAMTARGYLKLLDEHLPRILNEPPPSDYPHPAANTWRLSQKRLREANPAAAYLLELLAFFAPEPIPTRLLNSPGMIEALVKFDPALRDPLLHGALIRDISRFGLARFDPTIPAIRIHRLVQTVVRSDLAELVQQERRRQVQAALAAERRDDPERQENWQVYQSLRPHLESSGTLESDDPQVQELVVDMTRYMRARGDLPGSQELAQGAIASWLPRLGEDSVAVLRIRRELANTLLALGEYDEASRTFEDIIQRLARTLGRNHPYTLIARRGLPAALRGLGRYHEAYRLDTEMLPEWRATHGDDHDQTLRAATNLAISYRLVGNFQAAFDLNEDTLRRREKVTGAAQASTLEVAIRYGRDLRDIGDLQRSRERLEKAHATAREILGADHRITLAAAKNLVITWRQLGQIDEAYQLVTMTNHAYERLMRPSHPDALACALELACVRSAHGAHGEASQLAKEVLASYRHLRGADHPFTLAAANNLAIFQIRAGNYAAAKPLIEETATRFTNALGTDHPHTLVCQTNLANAHFATKEVTEALRLDQHCHQHLSANLKREHPAVLAAAANLAIALGETGARQEAATRLSEVAEASARILGPAHPNTIAIQEGTRINSTIEPTET
jgi:tetratricopeptide (TPR) repeat protein